jgi:hypothetical protein
MRTLDRQNVDALREILDEAWGRLSPELQAVMSKSVLAERILKSAAKSECDRERLIDAALSLAA